jgi:hypothetical protein
MRNLLSCSTFDAPANNVLQIEQPEIYSCRVFRYQVGHSVLIISLKTKEVPEPFDNFYLVFESVKYFSGPMWWRGANFCTGTLDEYGQLLHKIQTPTPLSEQDLPETYNLDKSTGGRLLIVETPNLQVKLIAQLVTITNDISDLP